MRLNGDFLLGVALTLAVGAALLFTRCPRPSLADSKQTETVFEREARKRMEMAS